MNLPQHVIDNIERRWAAKLQQEIEAWRKRKHPQQAPEPKTNRTDRTRINPPTKKISRAA
jgi:hypothetical protein